MKVNQFKFSYALQLELAHHLGLVISSSVSDVITKVILLYDIYEAEDKQLGDPK